MKPIRNWASICVVVAVLLASCFDPPQYSVVPAIEFSEVVFKDIADPGTADSLILQIKFRDGDGDLGLDSKNPQDASYPYNDKFYYLIKNTSTVITYKTRRTVVGYDTLPAFIKPYNCVNWDVTTFNNKLDTFYMTLNPNHYNIFVDFLVQQSNGSYVEFDWQKEFSYPGCGIPFDGRFPILSKDLSQKTPLDGTIRYAMNSVGFLILFSTKTLKLRVTVQDRALNKSNVVESQPFTLQSIRKSG